MDPYKLTYVAESTIHGKGLFARTRIKKGTYMGEYLGPVVKRNGSHVLWVCDDRGREIGRSGRNKLRYLNHSKRPNAEFDGFELFALKAIGPDQEITINYSYDPAAD